MKFKLQYTISVVLLIAGFQFSAAQKKGETIGSEVVNVVKPYTPTISDAFKVKETPSLDDDETMQKEDIKYNIFSFPVASTFAPAKGRAAGVDKTERETLFKNYLTLGIGNYGNAQAELFIVEEVGESGYFGGMLRHSSTQGGVEDVVLDDKFMNTSLDLTYGLKQNTFSWTTDAGYQHQIYNWYGIDQEHFQSPTFSFNDIDPQHTFHNAYIGSKISFHDSFFKEASVKASHFWDSYDSAENRFVVKPSFDFDIAATNIRANFIVDYVGGTFEKNYLGTAPASYGYANFGVHPSFTIVRNDWSIDLGAAAFYSMDVENSDGDVFVYPQVKASLNVVGDLMIFYAGAEGTLEQNSYKEFADQNPFISPYVSIAPTDRQYDVFAGLKGKLANSVSYNLKASYMNEQNRALFKNNPFPTTRNAIYEGYEYGNSFGIVYDQMTTLSFYGELKADFSKTVAFGINGTFASYNTDLQAEAWNLPELRVSSSLDVNITKKWYAGANVFFVGERSDYLDLALIAGNSRIVKLDPYFDANLHVGYQHNERFSGFLKFNNIANQAYEKWINYPVQQFQVMLGANYKFDF